MTEIVMSKFIKDRFRWVFLFRFLSPVFYKICRSPFASILLKGDYTWIPFSPNVFLNYLLEISVNPKMLSQDHSASSHKSEGIFSRFLN